MLPYNPYIFVGITVVLAVVPIIQAGMPGVVLPPWLLLGIAVINVACATLLKMMAPGHDVHTEPPPTVPSAEDVAREYIRLRKEERQQAREVVRG